MYSDSSHQIRRLSLERTQVPRLISVKRYYCSKKETETLQYVTWKMGNEPLPTWREGRNQTVGRVTLQTNHLLSCRHTGNPLHLLYGVRWFEHGTVTQESTRPLGVERTDVTTPEVKTRVENRWYG